MEFEEHNGAFWEIFYYTRKKITVSEEEEQRFVDRQTRELQSTFDPPPGLSPADYSSLFLNHFMKARSDSRDLLDKGSVLRTRNRDLFQIGNLECMQSLQEIESSPDFDSWENPGVVEFFRNISKSFL